MSARSRREMEGREIIWDGDRFRLVRASTPVAGGERVAPWEAADIVRRWGRARSLLQDASLAEVERTARELQRFASRLMLVRFPSPRPVVSFDAPLAGDLRELTDDPGYEDRDEIEHWIEIRLVDEAARPISAERYVLELPDGRTRSGRTTDLGIIRVDGMVKTGACRVHFPDLEARLAAS